MRAVFLFVLVGLLAAPASVFPSKVETEFPVGLMQISLDSGTSQLGMAIDDARQSASLEPLMLDTLLSVGIRAHLPDILRQLPRGAESTSAAVSSHDYIPDPEQESYVSLSESLQNSVALLMELDAFQAALRNERYNTMILSVAPRDSQVAALAVFLRRLVDLDLIEVTRDAEGFASILLSGRVRQGSEGASLSVLASSDCAPQDELIGGLSRPIDVHGDGTFTEEVTLAGLETGDYAILVNVREWGSQTMTVAKCHRFTR